MIYFCFLLYDLGLLSCKDHLSYASVSWLYSFSDLQNLSAAPQSLFLSQPPCLSSLQYRDVFLLLSKNN